LPPGRTSRRNSPESCQGIPPEQAWHPAGDGHNLGGGGALLGAGIMPNVEAPAEDEALATAERTVAAEVDPSSS
jgi:hypothetical protein